MLSYSLKQLLNNLNSTKNALGNMKITAHHDHLTGPPDRTALDDLAVRLGGDEFVLVVKKDADIIAKNILSEVKKTMILESAEVEVG